MPVNDDPPTPRAEDGTVVQSPADAARILAGTNPIAVGVPGFEIESTLGRGGMGVVYKATQTGLNRVVALKMLIAGQYADPSARARFLLEAESVAALEHPHIIRVFAFGESGGHPYLAMEYVPGGTLAERIKANGPLPAKEATELLAKLAAAVAHAHSRGVVHRDIKPLNVLLTAEGEPRLTDFGLAKVGRSDQHLSMTGQVLGTPAYMSPEQAAGKVHEVGTAADVYALGAVLYDLLTGRPPFTGDSAAVTLQKVISEEPERLRKLNASIPRDLETICLKCLEKEPAKRYPTAQALADDLLRYLRNEPISVRPAGVLERGYKWVRRNKVVAGAMAAVSLALLVGAGVSLGFGLEAEKQAKDAREKKKDAEDATKLERAATAEAEKQKQEAIGAFEREKTARNEVARKNDQLNQALAKALLGPITGKNTGISFPPALTPYEMDVFWQIAELRPDEIALLFVEKAIQTPLGCEQLEGRAEYAIHAALGLDLVRRNAVDLLFFSRLQDPDRPANQKVSLATSVSKSGFASSRTALLAAQTLTDAIANEPDNFIRAYLSAGLVALAVQMEPAEAVCILTDAIAKEGQPYVRLYLVTGFAALAARLEPAEAAKVCAQTTRILIDKLAREQDSGSTSEGLVLLAAWMDPNEAAEIRVQAVRTLSIALPKGIGYDGISLVESLAVLSSWMGPAEAAEVARVLTDALAKEPKLTPRYRIAMSLATVAARMEPAEAARVCTGVARTFIDALAKEKDVSAHDSLARVIAALATRMEPSVGFRTLTEILTTETTSSARHPLVAGLKALAPRSEPGETAEAARVFARVFANAFAQEKDYLARRDLAECLVAVTARIEPAEAARVLTDALAKESSPIVRNSLVAGLGFVTMRMEPAEAARVLTDLLPKEPLRLGRLYLTAMLAAATARMEPEKGAKLCAQSAREIAAHAQLNKRLNADHSSYLVVGLATVATRMEPTEAVRTLSSVLAEQRHIAVPLADVLVAVALADRLEPACTFREFPSVSVLRLSWE